MRTLAVLLALSTFMAGGSGQGANYSTGKAGSTLQSASYFFEAKQV